MIDFQIKLKKDGTYEITKYIGGCREVNIPQLINNIEVTSIGESAFENCASLTTITIPNSVTSIGDWAFFGCTIEKAKIPSIAIRSIKNSKLKEVIITSGNKIGDSAFAGCIDLRSVIIPESVTSIGSYAFQDCKTLTNIIMLENVTSIGYYAFAWCDSLETVTIPNSVTKIGKEAFYSCNNLKKIYYKGKTYTDINEVIELVNKQES